MPDLLSTLAGQVADYSDETLTCALYELHISVDGAIAMPVGAFHRRRHAPRGLVEARMYDDDTYDEEAETNAFTWPCRSPAALAQLLAEWSWSPFCPYFLVLRRGRAGGNADFPWPPRSRVPIRQTEWPVESMRNDLRAYFPPVCEHYVKVLYAKEWKRGSSQLAWEGPDDTRGWERRVAAAAAEAVFTLVGEC
jgi:hypothetical protein